jgi:gliding motility-associated-like protein
MKKPFILLIGLLLTAFQSFSQMYILNEDFNGASGTTPPVGWNNIIIVGDANDKWHFDNPGNRVLNYPIIDPFAIFDSDSTSANGQPEEVVLETPLFDASISNYILLHFAQTFDPGTGGTAKIEAFDGTGWTEVTTYSAATSNPSIEMVDLSAITGGVTNARLRFIWTGNGSGFWAIDNIRIYASLPLDGGIVSLDSPVSPVTPGLHNVGITLGNFGYNTLTTTKIDWTANGIAQPPHTWNGSIGFGHEQTGVIIGTYNFQDPVLIKVWQSDPNGGIDLNPYNDTVTKFLVSPLNGPYTIGGTDPDFDSFSQVADVLNIAGITGPVTFFVRNGIYYDEFILRDIQGTSAMNTITFRSESGDSTLAILKIIPGASRYESLIYLDGTQYINFRQLGLYTGSSSYANNALLLNGADNITIEGCHFEVRNQSDLGIGIRAGCQNIGIQQNRFECVSSRAGAINISEAQTSGINILGNIINGASEWGYYTIKIGGNVKNINLIGNQIEGCYSAVYISNSDSLQIQGNVINNSNYGVFVDNVCSNIDISGNRLTNIKSHPNVPDGTGGIILNNSLKTKLYNNFIHTSGDGPIMGISLEHATLCQVCFNSINITNDEGQGKSNGIKLTGCSGVVVKNNISNVLYAGAPVYIGLNNTQLDFDHNDYYSSRQAIGYFNGILYTDLLSWVSSLGMDENTLSVIPFYESATDLSINQVMLKNAGTSGTGINFDIDNTPRNPVNPTIGAKEYPLLCNPDAGINTVTSPANPLNGGLQNVSVLLQNQGSNTLTSVSIHWMVNDLVQTASPWSGNLASGANLEVSLGNYNFQPGILYQIKAWTTGPNGSADCNYKNDTILSGELAVPLCGTYTIGGSNPDFNTIMEVVNFLNLTGITCPVTFLIRDGIFYEQIILKDIRGASEENTITFCSASADSTKAVIHITSDAIKFESMVYLEKTKYVFFERLGFITGSDAGFFNNAVLLEGAKNIEFKGCYFGVLKNSDLGIGIVGGSEKIEIKSSRFECSGYRASAINVADDLTRDINIQGNQIHGANDWGYVTINIGSNVRDMSIVANQIEHCYRAIHLVNMDSVLIRGNIISNSNDGIYVNDGCTNVEISGNRLIGILGHENAPEGTSGIFIDYTSNAYIFNNYIQTGGAGPVIGINLQNSTLCRINYNSLNITNTDIQNKSKGIFLKSTSNIIGRNNIFKITESGTPIYISTNNSQIDFDYNDYYNIDETIGYYNGNFYTDLISWKDSMDMDIHSLSVEPFYNSATDLSINQALLNNAGSPVSGILVDIDGDLRNPLKPDIGAKEYSLCANDAGINAILSPENPLSGGIAQVRVMLQNQGTSGLTSANINWLVNTDLQTPYSWTGNLAAGANIEVNIGEYNFQNGSAFVIKVWTSVPNNSTDCNHNNDTVYSDELSGSLCGTYTIGGNNPDFISFHEVAEVLNTAGISCPVTFLLRDGTYFEKLIIREIKGSSDINTVTFCSESGDSALAVIRLDPDAAKYETMLYFDKTQHIIFKGLGLFTGSDVSNTNNAILLNGTKDIEFSGCYFESLNASDFGLVIQGGSQGISVKENRFDCPDSRAGAINITGNLTRDIDIIGNTIKGPPAWGCTLMKIGNNAGIVNITDNVFERSYRSVFMEGADSIRIVGNSLKNSNDGIYVSNLCSNIEIEQNRLINIQSDLSSSDGTSGIFVQNSTKIDIINNYIQTSGAGPVIGINLVGASSCRTYYNSVNTTNTDAQGKSRGMYLKSSSGILARDNIFSIKNLGIPVHIDVGVTALNLDYNDYYSPAGIIGKVNDMLFSNIAEWGLTVNGDANSKVVNPYFKSDTVPIPFQRILNGAGIPLAGILYDIDGKLRFSQAPDIGCIEFFVDYGILDLISPTLSCVHEDQDSVVVYIKQFGDVPFNDLKVAYQLNNGPVLTDTIPGPVITDVIHSFGTFENISVFGDYLFRIWLIGTLDDNINNDTLEVMRFSRPPPVVTMDYDNFCTGWEVNFTGQASVESPYTISGYEWLFGDGESSHDQNAVHTFLTPGTYQVALRAYSSAGCYGEIITPVFIDPSFQGLRLDYNLINETCRGDSTGRVELMATGGYPPYNYFVNGTQVAGNMITPFPSGKHEIRVEDSQNCSFNDSIESYPLVNMDPQIQANPLSGYAPLTVDFDFTVNNAVGWTWHFTELQTDSNKSVTYTFLDYGTHEVVLDVASGPPYFCTETAVIEIFVDVIVTIDPNSVFTPNGDGYNDFFEIKTQGVKVLNVSIFNRWGNKMFEIDSVNGKWDGNTTAGAKAPDGTYFYSLVAKGLDERNYERKGSVMLLRHGAETYPNPVENKVNIKINDPLDAPVTISVYSVFGQLVHSEILDNPENLVVDISHLSSGIYILKVNDGKQDYFARIIKN